MRRTRSDRRRRRRRVADAGAGNQAMSNGPWCFPPIKRVYPDDGLARRSTAESKVPSEALSHETGELGSGLSVAAIWLATLAAALFSPDLITGSQHEHLPL